MNPIHCNGATGPQELSISVPSISIESESDFRIEYQQVVKAKDCVAAAIYLS